MSSVTIMDTDILIDAARQVPDAIYCIGELEKASIVAVSVITQMELLVGCRSKIELRHTERFLRRFRLLKLNEQISDQALALLHQYRLSHSLAIPDALIAATALVQNMPLISKNQGDYRFIAGLQLLSYPFSSAVPAAPVKL